jgi:hypothetical protein
MSTISDDKLKNNFFLTNTISIVMSAGKEKDAQSVPDDHFGGMYTTKIVFLLSLRSNAIKNST